MSKESFWCISCYEGDVSWVNNIKEGYHLYVKGDVDVRGIPEKNVSYIDNVGYNIYSYMRFIVDHYDCLPDVVVFCKNNAFPRHIDKDKFFDLTERKSFTCIEDVGRFKLRYPKSMLSSDNGMMELNTGWYVPYYPSKYFSSFYSFWKFIFDTEDFPRYIRFAPGANYVVPKENILMRSKSFYENLMNFVSHDQFSSESHMVERVLYSVWMSPVKESSEMREVLDMDVLSRMEEMAVKSSIVICCEKIRLKPYVLIGRISRLIYPVFHNGYLTGSDPWSLEDFRRENNP